MYLSQSMTTLVLLLMLMGVLFYQTIDIHKESVLRGMEASSVDLKATSVEHVVATSIPKAFNKALQDAELKSMQDGFFKNPNDAKQYIESRTTNITNDYLSNISDEYKKMGYDFRYTNTTVYITGMPDGYTFTVNYTYWYMLRKGNEIVKQRNVKGTQNITVKSIIDAYEWYRFKNPVYEKKPYWIETVNKDIYAVNESYWIEDFSDLAYIHERYNVWVKISVPAHKNISFIIEGKGTNTPNGDGVFDFFDDFDVPNINKWEYSGASPYVYIGGIIEMWGNWGGPWTKTPVFTNYIFTHKLFSTPFIFEFKGRVDNYPPGDSDIGMVYADGTNWVDSSNKSGYNPPAITINKNRAKYANGIPDTNWHKYKITIKSDSMSLYQDWSGRVYTKVGNLPSQGGVGITGDTDNTKGHKAYMDYVFVRKYANESKIHTTIRKIAPDKWNITISNNNTYDLVDYQVALSATNNSDDTGNKIYITSKNDHLNISAFRKEIKQFRVWIKLDSLKDHGATTFIVMKNNTYAQTRPYNIFDFFDDFEDWDGWSQYGNGNVTQTADYRRNGHYALKKTTDNDTNGGYKYIGKILGRNIILECWDYRPNNKGEHYDRVGVIDNNGNGYGIMHSCYDNYIGVDKRTNYNPTYSRTNFNHDIQTWYFMQLVIKDDGTILSNIYDENLNLLGSYSHTDLSYNNFTKVYVFGGYDYTIDDLRIRKYANYNVIYNKLNDNEWKITLQNPNPYNLTNFQVYFDASNNKDTNEIYLQNSNEQLNISQEVSKDNLLYINSNNFEMNDNYPSILDRLANVSYRTFGKGIKYCND